MNAEPVGRRPNLPLSRSICESAILGVQAKRLLQGYKEGWKAQG